ncbi:helix-turn-helix domain-containing protein [Clostridium sp. 19966]|uniref:helix-turn-helix domain-containing protein n=1 Tax=Clostridium sp. 19966 TaxID=2768166 RepID=UPI0028DF43FE|nr:helix-turn-helix domain-containing protein [Clostridium sp. 19966]MDT8718785.1 helix-turn-helix domain-containing protein [Clostridium sp. 19966]
MKIGEIIRDCRKKQNLTQEQVANYLNISAPAVNKWENGMSYPDITLLAPLARILKIDVNTLLAFNEELTESEVNRLGREVSELVSKEGYEKAFERGSELIKEYSSCDELILRVASILRLFLTTSKIEEKDKHERKLLAWIELVAASSNEKAASMSKILLAGIYREKKEYDKAQEILDKIPEANIEMEKQLQQALLFQSSEKFEEAYGVCEDILFKDAMEAEAALFLIIEMLLKENKFDEAEEYTERAKRLVEVFDLGAYKKYSFDLYLAKQKQDKEKAIELITKMVNEAESMEHLHSKLYRHRKWKNLKGWSKDKCESLAKRRIKLDKSLDFVKDDPRIRFLLEQ